MENVIKEAHQISGAFFICQDKQFIIKLFSIVSYLLV